MEPFQILLVLLLGLPFITSMIGFVVAVGYLKLRLPTTTRRAQTLQKYNDAAHAQLVALRPFLPTNGAQASEPPLSLLDEACVQIVLEIEPLLRYLTDDLLPELQSVWQVGLDSRLFIPFKVVERISTLEIARTKIDQSYQAHLIDRPKLRRLAELRQKYGKLQRRVAADLQRQRGLLNGISQRLEALRIADSAEFFDVELQIERLSDSLHEVETLFDFPSIDVEPDGIYRFRHAFDVMYPRIRFFDKIFPRLNYRLHQLARTQRYLLREQVRLADINSAIQQQLTRAESRQIDVGDLWQKYRVAQTNLEQARKAFRFRSTETYISMATSLTRRGDVDDTRLKLISAELRNILSETRTRLSTTVQLEHLNEAIQLLGDLHEEILGLVHIDGRPRYARHLSIITDLSLEFERRRESLENKRQREQFDPQTAPQNSVE